MIDIDITIAEHNWKEPQHIVNVAISIDVGDPTAAAVRQKLRHRSTHILLMALRESLASKRNRLEGTVKEAIALMKVLRSFLWTLFIFRSP